MPESIFKQMGSAVKTLVDTTKADLEAQIAAVSGGGSSAQGFFVNGTNNISVGWNINDENNYGGSILDGRAKALLQYDAGSSDFSKSFLFYDNANPSVIATIEAFSNHALIQKYDVATTANGSIVESTVVDFVSSISGHGCQPVNNKFALYSIWYNDLKPVIIVDPATNTVTELPFTNTSISTELDAARPTEFTGHNVNYDWEQTAVHFISDTKFGAFYGANYEDQSYNRTGFAVFYVEFTHSTDWSQTVTLVHYEVGEKNVRWTGYADVTPTSNIILNQMCITEGEYNKSLIVGIKPDTLTPITAVIAADTTVGSDYDNYLCVAEFDGVEYVCTQSAGWRANNAYNNDVGWYSVFKVLNGQLSPITIAHRYQDSVDQDYDYEAPIIADYTNKKFIIIGKHRRSGSKYNYFEATIDPLTGEHTYLIDGDGPYNLEAAVMDRVYETKPIIKNIDGVDTLVIMPDPYWGYNDNGGEEFKMTATPVIFLKKSTKQEFTTSFDDIRKLVKFTSANLVITSPQNVTITEMAKKFSTINITFASGSAGSSLTIHSDYFENTQLSVRNDSGQNLTLSGFRTTIGDLTVMDNAYLPAAFKKFPEFGDNVPYMIYWGMEKVTMLNTSSSGYMSRTPEGTWGGYSATTEDVQTLPEIFVDYYTSPNVRRAYLKGAKIYWNGAAGTKLYLDHNGSVVSNIATLPSGTWIIQLGTTLANNTYIFDPKIVGRKS